MSDHRLILIVATWARHLWSSNFIRFSSDCKSLSIWTELSILSVITWARNTWLILIHELSSLSSSSNPHWWVIVSHNWLVSIVMPRAWDVCHLLISRPWSYRNWFGIWAKGFILCVITWSWLIEMFLTHNIRSLSSAINLSAWTLISHFALIFAVCSWTWHFRSRDIVGLTPNLESLSIRTKRLVLRVVTRSRQILLILAN